MLSARPRLLRPRPLLLSRWMAAVTPNAFPEVRSQSVLLISLQFVDKLAFCVRQPRLSQGALFFDLEALVGRAFRRIGSDARGTNFKSKWTG